MNVASISQAYVEFDEASAFNSNLSEKSQVILRDGMAQSDVHFKNTGLAFGNDGFAWVKSNWKDREIALLVKSLEVSTKT